MRKNMKNKKEQKEPEIRRLKVMRAPVHPTVAHRTEENEQKLKNERKRRT